MSTKLHVLLLTLLCVISFTTPACSDSDAESSGDDTTPADAEVYRTFEGSLSAGGTQNELTGVFQIDHDGQFHLEAMTGELFGRATKTDTGYEIEADLGNGAFYEVELITGELSLETDELTLGGMDTSDEPVDFSAQTRTIEEMNQAFRDSLDKAAVYFTHSESCEATITIDDTTIDPLGPHWRDEGHCDPYYDPWYTMTQDVDGQQSKTFCSETRIRDLATGEHTMHTFCTSAVFVLDKNTEYTYTAEWSNGETTSGTFTTPDGGERIPICISNDGSECEDTGSGEELRIDEQSLEVDQDYVERANPGLEEYDPDYWSFNFSGEDLSVRNTTALWIGHVAWSQYSFVRFYAPDGLAAETYDLDNPEGVELQVVLTGDKSFAFDIDYDHIPEADSKGKVTINNINYETGRLSITFQDVIVRLEARGDHASDQHMKFSGTVSGTFDEVNL